MWLSVTAVCRGVRIIVWSMSWPVELFPWPWHAFACRGRSWSGGTLPASYAALARRRRWRRTAASQPGNTGSLWISPFSQSRLCQRKPCLGHLSFRCRKHRVLPEALRKWVGQVMHLHPVLPLTAPIFLPWLQIFMDVMNYTCLSFSFSFFFFSIAHPVPWMRGSFSLIFLLWYLTKKISLTSIGNITLRIFKSSVFFCHEM